MAQSPRTPDVKAQRAAMKRLDFLVGEWTGEASVLGGQGQVVELVQTESAQFKLERLLLEIEGVGRLEGRPVLQALGLINFDDNAGRYQMRAFNDGRWLETEVTLADDESSLTWGFVLGDIRTSTVLRINDKGEWTEDGQLTIGDRPSQKMMDLRVRRTSR